MQRPKAEAAKGSVPGVGVAGGKAAGGSGDKPKRSTAAKVRTLGGVRTMKMYSLTEGEIEGLAQIQTGAAVSYSFASACAGFWISVTQAIDFSENLAPITLATWDTWRLASLIAGILSLAVGVWMTIKGRTRLRKIKEEMEHD